MNPTTTRYRDLFDLTGKTAIVTGASKGIGEAIARCLAEFGARVILASRKQETVDAVAKSIRESGGQAAGFAAHMGDKDAIVQLLSRTVEVYGGVDIVVNNAAVNPVYGPLREMPDDAFDKIMSVNVKGPLELARRAQPLMAGRGGGSVINISSVGGIRPEPMLGLYSASKAALINLTKAMAQEWARDRIRSNVICPGLVRTKFSAALWQNEQVLERFLHHVPMGRIAEPEEIVGLALYHASPASAYCTGAVFAVDGGHTM
jgi:NAD(P)-dependent dehydrogenase (short-subunit alcohol dehydrogenase family)